GNVRIVIDSPAVFISDRGENRDPWRKGRPLGTLKGAPAARVARTLLDYRRNWRISELITVSRASSGATYRVLDYLEREDLVLKSDSQYCIPYWERYFREFSSHSVFQTKKRAQTFIEPHGVGNFLDKLPAEPTTPVVVPGSFAAKEWTTYAPANAVYAY